MAHFNISQPFALGVVVMVIYTVVFNISGICPVMITLLSNLSFINEIGPLWLWSNKPVEVVWEQCEAALGKSIHRCTFAFGAKTSAGVLQREFEVIF